MKKLILFLFLLSCGLHVVARNSLKTNNKKYKPHAAPTMVAPTVTQAVSTIISENMAIEVDSEMFDVYNQMNVNPTAGSDGIGAAFAPQADDIIAEQLAREWLKNPLPSMQQIKAYAYEHRFVIAAIVTVAAVIGGGYYWYKKSKVAKKQQN